MVTCLFGTQRKSNVLVSFIPQLSISIQLLCNRPWYPSGEYTVRERKAN